MSEEVESGPGPRLREGPALEPGTLTGRMLRGLVVLRGGRWRSGLPAQPLIIIVIRQGYHRIVGPGRDLGSMTDVRVWTAWGLAFLTCPDVICSCPQQFHRRLRREPSQWSPRLPGQHTQTTRQVWWARQTRQLWRTRQVWRAHDSAGYESAGGLGSEVDEPEIVCDSATVADSAQHQDAAAADSAGPQNPAGNDSALPHDSAGDGSAQPQDLARDDSASSDGPAAQGTPAGTAPVDRQDTSIVSDVSSLMFPSMPRRINQATLLDFMSMWTGVWLQTPSPGLLFRHRRVHMIILHLEDQRLQSDVPGLQTDDPGCPSDVPEGWMNLEIPHVLNLPSEGRPP